MKGPLSQVWVWVQRACPAHLGSCHHWHCLHSPEEDLTPERELKNLHKQQCLPPKLWPRISTAEEERRNDKRHKQSQPRSSLFRFLLWFACVCCWAQTLFHILAHTAPRKTQRKFPPLLSGFSRSSVRALLWDSFQLGARISARCHLTLLGASVGKVVRRNAVPQPIKELVVLLGQDAAWEIHLSWHLGIRLNLERIFHP